MEYKIVSSGSHTDIEFQVNDLLKSGWEPHGSLAIARDEKHQLCLFQPVTRKEKKIKATVKTTKPAF